MSLKVKSNGINFNVPTIEDLPTERLEEDLVCVVTDENRGGVFVYREANALVNNGGTIFNGWTRQYDGAVNVKWFGAKGDGVTDDRLSIQMAFDTALQIYFPSTVHSYYIDNLAESLIVRSNISIYGEGIYSKLTISTSSLLPLFDIQSNSNILISSIALIGNNTTQQSLSSNSTSIVCAPGASNIVVSDCIIDKWTRHGISLDGVSNANIQNNTISNSWIGAGVLLSQTVVSNKCSVIGNIITNTKLANIHSFFGVNDFTVSCNICDGTNIGITGGELADNITCYVDDLTGALENVTVSNNVLKNSGNHGIHVGGDNITISGNSIFNPSNVGIIIAKSSNTSPNYCHNIVVSSNVVMYDTPLKSTARGISIRNAINYSIVSNSVTGGEVGIELNGIDTVGAGLYGGVISSNSLNNFSIYGIWIRNKVESTSIYNNSLTTSTSSNDIREDLVGTTSSVNTIYGNMSVGTNTKFAQMLRATAYNVLSLGNVNGEHLRIGSSTAGVVNYVLAAGNSTGGAVILGASGMDSNIDLQLSPKGSGTVKYGVHSATTDAPITGYITIKDSAGTIRKLATIQ